MKVIHTGLEQKVEQKVATFTPPGNPTGTARIGLDPAIRGVDAANGSTYIVPLGSDTPIYGEVANQLGFGGGKAYVIVDPTSGKVIHLLARNTTAVWLFADSEGLVALQTKITKAIADLS